EALRGFAHVAVVTLERAPDQLTLDLVQRQLLEGLGAARLAQTEPDVGAADTRTGCQEHRALDGVLQLAHVAGPGMLQQRLHGLGLEALERLAVAARVALQELGGEQRDVLTPVAQRR